MTLKIGAALLATVSLSACATLPSETPAAPVTVQILAINDFHGHLETSQSETRFIDNGEERRARLGGAAELGATLAALRTESSVTVAAGDLIGASPLISSLFLDEPSIRALSEIGLNIASVGNHEFDRGLNELYRMQNGGCDKFTQREPCAVEPFAGADFAYLAGNVVDASDTTFFPATQMREIGGAQIGFIGLTLEGTANLVAASATEGYSFLDEAETANRYAAQLRADGADAVVLLIHEGAEVQPRYNISGCPELGGAVVPIVEALDASISAVVSGHTHQAYVCNVTTSAGAEILLTSGGRYGGFVTDITLQVDPASDSVLSISGRNVPVDGSAGSHAVAADIVRRYAEASGPVANRAVGTITDTGERGEDCFDTSAQALVSDAQLAAARTAMDVSVDAAFVNSGGVRTDLSSASDGVLTYGELAAMQPFNNGITILEMTGEELKATLEEQFCEDSPASICQSSLAPSANFNYTINFAAPAGERASNITLDGAALDPSRTYRIAVNSFLAGGGDGFTVLENAEQLGLAGFDIDALEAYVATGNVSVPVCGRVRNITPRS